MKEINELNIAKDVRYAPDHEWARLEGQTVKIGISDYAQDQLGDIVFVELPQIGARFAAGEEFGNVESVKTVSELYMPLGGEVTVVNTALEEAPEQVNLDPYGSGWMIEIKPDDPAQIDSLMDHQTYLDILKGKPPCATCPMPKKK